MEEQTSEPGSHSHSVPPTVSTNPEFWRLSKFPMGGFFYPKERRKQSCNYHWQTLPMKGRDALLRGSSGVVFNEIQLQTQQRQPERHEQGRRALGVRLPWEFRWLASSGDFGGFLGSPVVTQFHVTGVRAVAAVQHGGDQAVSVDFIWWDTTSTFWKVLSDPKEDHYHWKL